MGPAQQEKMAGNANETIESIEQEGIIKGGTGNGNTKSVDLPNKRKIQRKER
jgi:hypothetical protein